MRKWGSKRLTYSPKATRLVGGRTFVWIHSMMLNYQALKSVLLTDTSSPTVSSLEGDCEGALSSSRGPCRSTLSVLLHSGPCSGGCQQTSSTGYSSFQQSIVLCGWRVQASQWRKKGDQGIYSKAYLGPATPLSLSEFILSHALLA